MREKHKKHITANKKKLKDVWSYQFLKYTLEIEFANHLFRKLEAKIEIRTVLDPNMILHL